MEIKAPAKVNLFLRILGKRPDGYHELFSVLQMVSLYDRLTIETTRAEMDLVTSARLLPTGGRNLIIRAARLLARRAGIRSGARIMLEKHIPVGAGLGGGSSDAAATLVALNRLWKIGFSREDLARMSQELGSDVPFFLHGPSAIVRGRGEQVIPCAFEESRWLVLINPGFEVSTRWAYENFGRSKLAPSGSGRVKTRQGEKSRLTITERRNKIKNSDDKGISQPGLSLHNDLEAVTARRYPSVQEMKDHLVQSGATAALMSGSGPSVFGVFEDRATASRAAGELRRGHPGWKIWAVQTLRRSPF